MRAWWTEWCLLLIFLCFQPWNSCEGIAVMSVDLGSEWMKIAIVSPGVPMEIALNKESKRKTPVAVAFRDGERSFGEDAAALGVRFPANSYAYLPLLLGQKVNSSAVRLYKRRFPYHKIVADPDRGTVVFQHDSETQYSVEELVGMLLEVARSTAQSAAGDKHVVREAVITVPGHWGQAERRSLLVAAQLSGIKVLQLINDHMAVALNYGIFRRKDFNETAQYIMFYDMGASSTTATIASYQMVKTKERGFLETNPQVSIIGLGYDRTLGGLEMQLRLRDFLAHKFNSMGKTKTDVFTNPRALAKLFKEAGRLKNVLSANQDHYAQVEGLIEDIDFKLQVTRDQFQELCSDLFDRVKGPVDRALESSGLTMDVINQVILVGAGTRVPRVQEVLSKAVGMDLGKSLNTDEAAAMGAVYRAADLSAGFKVKKFITKDAVLFPIQVTFEREVEGKEGGDGKGIKLVRRTLFGAMNPYPQKKILTFNKHTDDFVFRVSEAVPETDHLSEGQTADNEVDKWMNLTEIHISGVASALKKVLSGPGSESKGVKAHFTMDDSGILSLAHTELLAEKTLSPEEQAAEEERKRKEESDQQSPLSKLGSTISKLFSGSAEESKKVENETTPEGGGGEEEEGAKAGGEDGEKKAEGSPSEGSTNGTKATGESAEADGKKKPLTPKVVVMRESVEVSERRLDVLDLEGKKLEQSIAKIKSLNEKDQARHRTESAMNALESFVFDMQMRMDQEEFSSASTGEEIEAILKECAKVSDWISDDGAPGMGAGFEDYESRFLSLKKLSAPLLQRVAEHRGRPEEIRTLGKLVEVAESFLKSAQTMDGGASGEGGKGGAFTQVELDTLSKLISDTKDWKAKMEEEQSKLPLSVAPKLTIKAIGEKKSALDRELKYLFNKIEIWKANKAKELNAASKGNKSESSSSGGSSENEEAPKTPASEEAEKGEQEDKDKAESGAEEDAATDDVLGTTANVGEDAGEETTSAGVESSLDEEKAHGEL
ncbi:hypoxia up-regulated protein 1 [Ischnura elegans]|uniref:hypoxia up-regulated protein 1 n=1 Tax=Ischnura elegans TaxID=197161 RepID=UPI001ED8AB92|nr:hypoxia up-regulated protein 1 [Ischnura elegans]XP_046384106.1 hypoxia up-regulated protein 1 [Ischnura elegans]